ncbi:MAG TPA: T9SS type A sorting domain-containing protein [Candidatus Kapabacteria bacterium]|nr:T9SS type A sorting domain-containing protein [Candidatus Kapabacteria bacterium]
MWPSITDQRNSFEVRGFNDSRGLAGFGQQIDISFNGIPNSTNSREVIKGGITTYQNVSVIVPGVGGGTKTVNGGMNTNVQGAQERDWHDTYDVCCDAVHLYIVWEQNDNMGNTFTWVTATKLSDNSVLPGFPKLVGVGSRPTIACDVRNSDPNVNSYVIANIDFTSPPSGAILYFHELSNGGIAGVFLNPSYVDPNGLKINYQSPKHARVVCGSLYGSQCVVTGVYAIVLGQNDQNAADGDDLIFHRLSNSAQEPNAYYIDGAHRTSHDDPIGVTAFPIVNQYIQAFGNPYDGQHSNNYDEFHCLYQLDCSTHPVLGDPNFGNFLNKPLLISGGHPDLASGSVEHTFILTPTTHDHGITWLTGCPVFISGIDNHYLAWVNQMGIHVFWESQISPSDNTNNRMYYSRDIRSLDEPIEENTLLSYYNRVADGTSHGGTLGATLQPGRILTMWTDPNVTSLYLPSPTPGVNNCRLGFYGANVLLSIGTTPQAVYGGDGHTFDHYAASTATLITLPNFEVHFADNCQVTNFQSIVLQPGSTWQYYGVPPPVLPGSNPNWGANFFGSGQIHLLGYGTPIVPCTGPPGDCPSGLSPTLAGTLFIHGGSTFVVPNQVTLKDTSAHIECLFEPDIKTISGTTNPSVSGVLDLRGAAVFNWCRVISHIPSTLSGDFSYFTIQPDLAGAAGSCTSLDPQVMSKYSVFANEPESTTVHKTSTISFTGNTSSINYRSATFTFGIDSAIKVDVKDPIKAFTIDGTVFRNSLGTVVHLHSDQPSPFAYDNLHVVNCAFSLVNQDVTPIEFDNLSTARTSSFDKILVDGNLISTTQTSSSANPTGIVFNNTNGKISGNTISGNGGGVFDGIVVSGNGLQLSTTFLCSNTISGCSDAGILTTNWKGFGRLNNVSTCGIGHVFGAPGPSGLPPKITYSFYTNCSGPGVKLNDIATTEVDFNKLKTADGAYDNAGFNTIANNNQAGSSTSAQIVFSGANNDLLELGGGVINADEHFNNIVANNTTSDLFAFCSTGTASLGDFRDNFFSTDGTNPFAGSFAAMTHNVSIDGFSNTTSTSKNTFSGVSCGNGYFSSIVAIDTVSSSADTSNCLDLKNKVDEYDGAYLFQQEYDTGKYYIEHCYNVMQVWRRFGFVQSAGLGLEAKSDTIWAQARNWLKSVLYLDPDSNYYCADLANYAGTFAYRDELGHPANFKTTLAILKYLRDSSHCSGFKSDFTSILGEYHRIWQDTVTDSLKTPFDSTLPNIDQAGQSFLRGFAADVSNTIGTISNDPFDNLRATENPFKRELDLKFMVLRPTVAKIEVYDALGRQMYTDGQGYLEAGEHGAAINSSGWSSGTYYVRLVTLQGQVKTLKLVHQE